MNVGTKSILFGAHQFILHPIFLFVAWWRLYGFPRDPRLWVAFVVHDLGYWGKPNMDGPEGEDHPYWGANLMSNWFDTPRSDDFQCPNPDCRDGWEDGEDEYTGYPMPGECPTCKRLQAEATKWYEFTVYHSRFIAKRHQTIPSALCIADKLAGVLMPWWMYIPMATLTGEIDEYMDVAHHREGGKYAEELRPLGSKREWHTGFVTYVRRWVFEHKDLGWMPGEPI